METRDKGYREKLVQQIKDAGEELVNRADTLIHPEITFSTSVVNKTACDRLCKKEV